MRKGACRRAVPVGLEGENLGHPDELLSITSGFAGPGVKNKCLVRGEGRMAEGTGRSLGCELPYRGSLFEPPGGATGRCAPQIACEPLPGSAAAALTTDPGIES